MRRKSRRKASRKSVVDRALRKDVVAIGELCVCAHCFENLDLKIINDHFSSNIGERFESSL